MTSVLNVDTIAAKDGTSPVGLTKLQALHIRNAFNLSSTTRYDMAQNTASSENFNVSSNSDDGTGLSTANVTNNLSTNQFIITGITLETNNCIAHRPDSTTSSVLTRTNDADSNAAQDNLHYFLLSGSLA